MVEEGESKEGEERNGVSLWLVVDDWANGLV